MQVNVETVSPVEKKLTVQIPWDTVKEKLAATYKELARGVAIKGFRKGKVPMSVVKQMYGKQVRAEVATQLVREGFLHAVQEHDLAVVTEPTVHDAEIKNGEDFTFHAHVEVRSEVALEPADYDKLEIERHPIEIGEDAVDRALEALRRDNTDLQPIEGRDVTARTDVLAISVKGEVGEHQIDRPQMVIDLEDTSREGIPGLAAALAGLPINVQDHLIELPIADDYPDESIAGKVAKLTVSILDARHKAVPELDDELAKDTGRAETLADLRKVLREELEARAAEEVQNGLRQSAIKALVKRHQIPVAPGLVERAAHDQLHRLKAMLGMPDDHASDHLIDEETQGRLREGALDDLRGEFLLDAVATVEDIQVTDEEVDERITAMASARGTHPSRLRPELERDGKLDSLKFSLRRDKTLDLLVARAVVTDAPKPEKNDEAPAGGAE